MLRYDRLLLIILVFFLVGLFYWVYYMGHEENSFYLIPVVMAIVTVYIFTPQIEWWGNAKYPIRVDKVIRKMLYDKVSFYRRLTDEEQARFDKRLWLSIRHKDWTGMKLKNIPEDIKAMVMTPAILLTFYKSSYLFEDYERIYLYKHPFPSPRYSKWHASEIHHEDGLLIFSIEQLFNAFLHPNKYYNIALHEWAGAYLHEYTLDSFVGMKWLDKEELNQIGPYDFTAIEAWLGLPVEDLRQVCIHHFIQFPSAMKQAFPDFFMKMKEAFS